MIDLQRMNGMIDLMTLVYGSFAAETYASQL